MGIKIRNKKIKKGNTHFNKLLILGIILCSSVVLGISYNLNYNQDVRSLAEEEVDFCKDKCIGQDRCGPNGPPGDPNYNDPCCEEIAKTGDPGACPWPQRGYCTDAQCGAIPEGVSRERCGGPRHSWCNECVSRNCPGYGSAPQITQTPPPSATINISPPSITSVPTVTMVPTNIPTVVVPTSYLSPTNPPSYITAILYPTTIVFPTSQPLPTSTPTSVPDKKFSLPNILPPKEDVIIFIDKFRIGLRKFLENILP